MLTGESLPAEKGPGDKATGATVKVASLERGSKHPLAEAIVKGAEERGLTLGEAKDFTTETGKGVTGAIGTGLTPFPQWLIVPILAFAVIWRATPLSD